MYVHVYSCVHSAFIIGTIRQHGSAVYVGMVMVVCMLQYKRKVVLLPCTAKDRGKGLPIRKYLLHTTQDNPHSTAKVRACQKMTSTISMFVLLLLLFSDSRSAQTIV